MNTKFFVTMLIITTGTGFYLNGQGGTVDTPTQKATLLGSESSVISGVLFRQAQPPKAGEPRLTALSFEKNALGAMSAYDIAILPEGTPAERTLKTGLKAEWSEIFKQDYETFFTQLTRFLDLETSCEQARGKQHEEYTKTHKNLKDKEALLKRLKRKLDGTKTQPGLNKIKTEREQEKEQKDVALRTETSRLDAAKEELDRVGGLKTTAQQELEAAQKSLTDFLKPIKDFVTAAIALNGKYNKTLRTCSDDLKTAWTDYSVAKKDLAAQAGGEKLTFDVQLESWARRLCKIK